MLEVVLMSNGDYREKIEEHRQSIELDEQQSSRMSRSRQVKKKKKKKPRKNPLLNILLVILLGIPFTLLIYVSFFYHPVDSDMAKVEENENGSIVEVQKNNTVSASGKDKVEPKIEETKTDDQSAAKDKASADNKVEDANLAEVEAAKKAEQAKREQEEKLAKQQEEQKQKEQQTAAAGSTHTVQPNENLFRIALKYYNDASGVDKIREANNLSSNSISVGQTLIIP